MFRVNGFHSHVKRNDLCSVALFAGFLLAFELVGALALLLPLTMYDIAHAPLWNSLAYLERWDLPVLGLGIAVFGVQFALHKRSCGFHCASTS